MVVQYVSNMVQFGTDVSAQIFGHISRGKDIKVELTVLPHNTIIYVSSVGE